MVEYFLAKGIELAPINNQKGDFVYYEGSNDFIEIELEEDENLGWSLQITNIEICYSIILTIQCIPSTKEKFFAFMDNSECFEPFPIN